MNIFTWTASSSFQHCVHVYNSCKVQQFSDHSMQFSVTFELTAEILHLNSFKSILKTSHLKCFQPVRLWVDQLVSFEEKDAAASAVVQLWQKVEATASLQKKNGRFNVDAAVTANLIRTGQYFLIKKEQRTVLEAFFFWLWEEFGQTASLLMQDSEMLQALPLASFVIITRLPTGSTGGVEIWLACSECDREFIQSPYTFCPRVSSFQTFICSFLNELESYKFVKYSTWCVRFVLMVQTL